MQSREHVMQRVLEAAGREAALEAAITAAAGAWEGLTLEWADSGGAAIADPAGLAAALALATQQARPSHASAPQWRSACKTLQVKKGLLETYPSAPQLAGHAAPQSDLR